MISNKLNYKHIINDSLYKGEIYTFDYDTYSPRYMSDIAARIVAEARLNKRMKERQENEIRKQERKRLAKNEQNNIE